MFEHKESYKHLYAKKVLADWFREEDKKHDYCKVAQFEWRSNYGIFEELAFYSTSDPYYFECSDCLKHEYYAQTGETIPENPLEWFDTKLDRGIILFVPDIVIFHKGTPKYFFEVVHRNSVSPEKILAIKQFFKGNNPAVYEVDAEFILRQIGVPKEIRCSLLIDF